MGNETSALTPEELQDYAELTFLNKQEIILCYKKFEHLARHGKPLQDSEGLTRRTGRLIKDLSVRASKAAKEYRESRRTRTESREGEGGEGGDEVDVEEGEDGRGERGEEGEVGSEPEEEEAEAEEADRIDVRTTLVPVSVVRTLPELRFNPFADRICSVFSSRSDSSLSFEDFLDMASVLSEHAPTQLKADWAFKMFDFDGDGYLGESDVRIVILRLTRFRPSSTSRLQRLKNVASWMSTSVSSAVSGGGGETDAEEEETEEDDEEEVAADGKPVVRLTDEEIDKIVDHIMHEADLNKSDTISLSEFRYIMSKSPDFAHNFRIIF